MFWDVASWVVLEPGAISIQKWPSAKPLAAWESPGWDHYITKLIKKVDDRRERQRMYDEKKRRRNGTKGRSKASGA